MDAARRAVLLQKAKELLRAGAFDFGGMIVFYALLYTLGLKAAIGGTILFVVADAIRRHRAGLGFPRIYVLTSALALVFGAIDLLAATPFMIQWEAVITSLFLAGMFGLGARGKSMLQELVEQRQGESFVERPDIRRFFQLLTLMWAGYFVLKALVYAWMGVTMPIERTMRLRPVIGTASLVVMFAISSQGRRLFVLAKRIGWLDAAA
jgi:intracellular septation protein A